METGRVLPMTVRTKPLQITKIHSRDSNCETNDLKGKRQKE